MAERGELIHNTTFARIVFVLAFDVGQAVQLLGSKADAVLDKLRFTERFELFLGGESFAVRSVAHSINVDAPRLLQVVQEENQERVRE